jgi:glycine betaine/choline ABC-type transport system substrate-binding protein
MMGGEPMRIFRSIAHGAALIALVLVLGACGSGVGGEDEGETGGGGGQPVASELTLGGPPECPKRPFCIPGFKRVYDIEFGDFKPLDVGGPLTVKALEGGQIDVALLFTTSSVIVDKQWVVLEDDKNLQPAENITPVVNSETLDPTIESLLNDLSATLTTDKMLELNGRVELDQEDPADVAADYLESEGLSGEGESGSGEVTVGAVAFAENQILGEMYAQLLEQAGYDVKRQTDLGSREVLLPALEKGEVDVAPEYVGTLLITLDPEAEASGDVDAEREQLEPLLEEMGLTLLESSDANDTNALVVTPETAEQYNLETTSDLAEPAG